ncbi:MerR family DNA-binding transcriptional regulator [Sphaerisporangium sp. NPDC004334]
MRNGLSIGEVAQRIRLSVHTLRLYEREGLLAGEVRGDDGGRRSTATGTSSGWPTA